MILSEKKDSKHLIAFFFFFNKKIENKSEKKVMVFVK